MTSETLQHASEVERLCAKADDALGVNNHEAALTFLREAVAKAPGDVNARFKLAWVNHSAGNVDVAIAIYRELAGELPNTAAVFNNLGNALRDAGDLSAASDALHTAVALAPDAAETYANLGSTLLDKGELASAEEALSTAVRLDPDNYVNWFNLANLYQISERLDEAVHGFENAARLNPEFQGAWNNLGNCYRTLGKFRESILAFENAGRLNPDSTDVWSNLGGVLCDAGDIDGAQRNYEKALELDAQNQNALSNLIYLLNYHEDEPTTELLALSETWGRRFASPSPKRALPQRAGENKLRVGYVSGDFRMHSVAYFLEPLLAAHDRARFEVFLYSNTPREDHVTERLRSLSDRFVRIVSMSDADVADSIVADGIDLLIDLSGHTGGNRLSVFGYRPAPVQASWLGYPNTTGVAEIDYRFTDAIADPSGAQALHSEKLQYLPGGFLCFKPDASAPAVTPAPMIGNDYLTFGSFNNVTKITPVVVEAWSGVLNAIPDARLVLKNRLLEDDLIATKYVDAFARHGVDRQRVQVLPRTDSYDGHMKTYGQIDIALDTFPYNGTTTTCEALWMGVPVLVPEGKTHRSRVTQSLLSRVGLEHYVVRDLHELATRANEINENRAELLATRESLRQAMQVSSLCDSERFAREIETLYSEIITSALNPD